jgi:hypothetical protein
VNLSRLIEAAERNSNIELIRLLFAFGKRNQVAADKLITLHTDGAAFFAENPADVLRTFFDENPVVSTSIWASAVPRCCRQQVEVIEMTPDPHPER